MKLENQPILVVSNEPWGDVWFSKHNYAFELSRKNRVLFLDPPQKWRPANVFSRKISLQKISESLSVLRYENNLPALTQWLFRVNNCLVSQRLRRFLSRQGFDRPILWTFDPYRLFAPRLLGARASIFHCADKYDFGPRGERLLALNCDHVFTIAGGFAPWYTSLNRSVHVVRHGISKDEFVVDQSELPAGLGTDYALYVGTIDQRLDYPLLEQAISLLPETTFVLIGAVRLPTNDAAAQRILIERRYGNVRVVGPVPFKKLKGYIAGARFCLAMMDKTHNGNMVSHHKILQYLALGKPVFCCEFSEYADIKHLLYAENDNAILLARLLSFVKEGEDPSLREQRISLASRSTFEEIFKNVEHILTASERATQPEPGF